MLEVHHINCGTMCPIGGRLFDGFSKGLTSELGCHCLLIETDQGLVLVDTGFGLQDVRDPHSRLSRFFLNFNNIKLREHETAIRRIQALGFDPRDVRHIVMTHLDFDHAGGISDFPNARVHVLKSELEHAAHPNSWLDRNRFRHEQWDMEKHWRTYSSGGEKWFGFDSVRDLDGLPPEILMIPLIGHTWGHSGIAVHSRDGWLLHAGDAYFYRGEMNRERYEVTPGCAFYQKMMEVDRESRIRNQNRLRKLIREHGNEVRVFSAHDKLEFHALASLRNTNEAIPAHDRSEPWLDRGTLGHSH
jgi:glyoxylase-like metal-dependent hydrolase (beta-lactamase superfamily II)